MVGRPGGFPKVELKCTLEEGLKDWCFMAAVEEAGIEAVQMGFGVRRV